MPCYNPFSEFRHSNSFKITKREVLFSIIIAAVLLVIGFIISGRISDSLLEDYQKYETAIQIDNDKELFEYGMRTNIGNAFVYGNLKAVDTVTYDEIDGEYLYIKKVKERYTPHTRTYTTTSNGHTHVHTQTYYTWDVVKKWRIHSNKISFLDVVFDYDTIPLPKSKEVATVKESRRVRYKYYAIEPELIGTIYTSLGDNTISDTEFYHDKNIEQTLDKLESGNELIVFWVIWILLICGTIFGFCYMDNRWLEDRN